MVLKGLRTLVTGGAGFVGANLVRELLAQHADVHALVRAGTDQWRLAEVRSRIQLHEVDLTDAPRVRRVVHDTDPHVIFHLAKHRGNPATLDYRAAYDANLGGTLNLLEAVAGRTSLRRFIQGGSSLEYDLTRSPLRESDAAAPATIHGVTKAAATLLCQQFARTHALPVVVLRFFTVYGPWEGRTRFVPSLLRASLAHESIRLTRPGLTHDWIYVGDVVDACLTAASTSGLDGEILNVATGVKTTNESIVRMVEELSGQMVRREAEPFPARPWDTDGWVADVSKTASRLGWRARTPLREGLERTRHWLADHLALYHPSSGNP